ncbi:MAG: thiamine phosphate synthase, partial [Actinomycetota bacterium]
MDDTRLYLVAPARLAAGELAALVPELVDAGVDLIQLREKEAEAGDVLRLADPILEACRAASVPFILNDRPDVALALKADGVHVGQNDLPIEFARRFLGDGILGLSTHSVGE